MIKGKGRKSQGAVGLMISLIALVILTIISATTAFSLRSLRRESLYQKMLLQAQNLAGSGGQDALEQLGLNENWRAGFNQKPLKNGYYTVALSTDTRPWVTSTGYAPSLAFLGRAFRTVKFRAAVSPIPQMNYGLMGNTLVTLLGDARINSFDSEVDPDPPSFGSSAAVWSNGAVVFTRLSYSVYGDCYYFVPPPPLPLTVSGAVVLSTYTQTLGFTNGSGYANDNDNATGISPASAYNPGTGDLTIASGKTVTLNSGIFYINNITMTGTLFINITNGPVVVFLNGNLSVTGGGKFSKKVTNVPPNFIIYGPNSGSQTYSIDSNNKFWGVIRAPNAGVTLNNEFFGAISAATITLQNGARFHQDLSLLRPKVNSVRIVTGSWSVLPTRL